MTRAHAVLISLAAVMAACATSAQSLTPAPGGVSLSDVQNAITAATPSPCTAPLPDTLNGQAGVGTPCMPRTDATRPTVVQAGNVVTDSNGNWSITFSRTFASTTPYVHAEPVTPGASLPYDCNVTARNATSAQGTCYQSYSTTLGGTLVAIAGTVISPFRNAGAGIAVMVVARDITQ